MDERESLLSLVKDFRTTLAGLERLGVRDLSSEHHNRDVTHDALLLLKQEITACRSCALGETRQAIFFGEGPKRPTLLFLGVAPSPSDMQNGTLFSGEPGVLLDKMLRAMGWEREQVYLANLVKCPSLEGSESSQNACAPWFFKQLHLLKPLCIVALGDAAKHLLAQEDVALGSWQNFEGIELMPTLHPEELLRVPGKKQEAWAHLQDVMKRFPA